MQTTLTIVIIVISIILIGLVLMQAKGVGLGRSFGSSSYHSRRGLERIVFRATIVISVIFVLLAVANQFLVK